MPGIVHRRLLMPETLNEKASTEAAFIEWQRQLIELQTQVAFQEDALSELDDVVAAQQRQIEQLTLLCERLGRQLEQVATSWGESGEETPPPHY